MSIVDARGREVRRATIEHNAAGLRELLELLSRAGAREVAIERPDGPVVDTRPTGERADWWWYEPFQPQPPPISN